MVTSKDGQSKPKGRGPERNTTAAGEGDPQPQLLRAREVAALCAVNLSTVWRWATRTSIPALPVVRFSARCCRFRLSDVEKFIRQTAKSQ